MNINSVNKSRARYEMPNGEHKGIRQTIIHKHSLNCWAMQKYGGDFIPGTRRCELPKGHQGKHSATCDNAQFHQGWSDEYGETPIAVAAPEREANTSMTTEQARELCDSLRRDPEIGQAIQDIQSWKPDGLARIIARLASNRRVDGEREIAQNTAKEIAAHAKFGHEHDCICSECINSVADIIEQTYGVAMQKKWAEVTRWALNKGAEVMRVRAIPPTKPVSGAGITALLEQAERRVFRSPHREWFDQLLSVYRDRLEKAAQNLGRKWTEQLSDAMLLVIAEAFAAYVLAEKEKK